MHHPYDSFAGSVERFIQQAVRDPEVLAIKMTVYRTSDDSALIPALKAAERGKQAVCLVELKARFDERRNIGWARAGGGRRPRGPRPAGAQDARQGAARGAARGLGRAPLRAHRHRQLPRQDRAAVRGFRPVHHGPGSPRTWPSSSTRSPARPARRSTARPSWLPTTCASGSCGEVERTVEAHRNGLEARIVLKMNSLVDARCIRALYAASQAGVRVDVNVRGICLPARGVPGVREHPGGVGGRALPRALPGVRLLARR